MNDSILYDKMVAFVLSEVDYAVENGYSRRARRFMRRNLEKELKELKETNDKMTLVYEKCESSDSDEDSYDLSINIYKYKTPVYISVIYVGMLFAFYMWAAQSLYVMIELNTTQTDNME